MPTYSLEPNQKIKDCFYFDVELCVTGCFSEMSALNMLLKVENASRYVLPVDYCVHVVDHMHNVSSFYVFINLYKPVGLVRCTSI